MELLNWSLEHPGAATAWGFGLGLWSLAVVDMVTGRWRNR
jgi:hypothetical protein